MSSPPPLPPETGPFEQAADTLGLTSSLRALLERPAREFTFAIPVRLDDGRREIFPGFRIVHNDARGPATGGFRFHPAENLAGIRGLAMHKTWQCAVADIPLGGAHGGVICDPHRLSDGEQERLCRGWVRQALPLLGPQVDVPSPDLMTSARHMAWMLDEYETLVHLKAPGAVSGKPLPLGGSLGRAESTGYGLVFMLRETLRELGIRLESTTASVQGLGMVARHAIRLYQQIGGTVVAVSCLDPRTGLPHTLRKAEGIPLDPLLAAADPFGGVDPDRALALGCRVEDGTAWLREEVDLLIPAALEDQLTPATVGLISPRVRVIAEGASGPTDPAVDPCLAERGITVIPDFLAGSGGVIGSYFEQIQSNTNLCWEKDEMLGRLDVKMTTAYLGVAELARQRKVSLRQAAYLLAVSRVAEAVQLRGWA